MKMSKFVILRPFLGAAAAVALAFLPVATYSTVISDTLTADETKLLAFDGAAGDFFGFSVSVSGETAVVGALGGEEGSAYVFEKMIDGWVETAKFAASGGRFGISVSVSDDIAVVGAHLGDDDNGLRSGAAHVFENLNGTWAEAVRLTASDGAPFDFFGGSVSASGNTAVIGAVGDDDNGLSSGSAYVFENIGGVWVEVAKLTASDGAADDFFGGTVSVSGDTAVIGARGDDDNGSGSGSAYVFEKLGGVWVEVAKLTTSDGAAGDSFALSVSVSGDTAIVGAAGDDDNGTSSGSTYVFKSIGGVWAEVAKLTASDGAAVDFFGFSVSVSGDTAVVGADSDDDNGSNSGSAYVFEKIGGAWVEVAKLTASDGAEGDEFGVSVALSGNTVLVGAWLDGWGMTKPGSAWVFEFRDLTPEEQTDNLIAGIEDLVADGTLSSGAGTSLTKQLENALKSLDKGNDKAVINQLAAFANQVQALIDGGLVTEEEGLPLIDGVLSIIDQILAG